jgi:putative ABC transport system substrate-binding protein
MAPQERSAERGAARVSAGLSRRVFVQRVAGLGAVTVLAACSGPPLTPPAPPKLRRIGYLSALAKTAAMNYAEPFREQLRKLGYVEGRDVDIVLRPADGDADRLPGMAAELVALPVDVLLAESGLAHNAARAATKTIPIVLTLATDPVASGLLASYARPGGNITGVMTLSARLSGKRVEFLKDTVPGLARVGIIWNASLSTQRPIVEATQAGARTLGVDAQVFGARTAGDVDAAVEAIARQHLDGLVMLTGNSIFSDPSQVPDIAAKHRLPQIVADIEVVRAGGLMYYGANYATMYQKAALQVHKIFKGASPADMPIEQPTQFDFIVNLKMAQRLGLTIPVGVLRQATAVIS